MTKIFKTILIALMPATLLALYNFRERALIALIVGVGFAVGSEALFQTIFKRKATYRDGGAIVTGLLLGLSVSPSTPWYVVALASSFAIVVGKQVMGGFPKNMFNPTILGRLFIIYMFPTALRPWLTPVDMVTTATPLGIYRETGMLTPIFDLFVGNIGGSMGEISSLALLIGAAYLFYKKMANWRLPVGVLSTVAVVAILLGQNPFFHLFSGSLMLVSLFMITDPATSPKSNQGRWIFAVGVGLVTMIIRTWGPTVEGTTFAILGMNYLAPFIDSEVERLKTLKAPKAV